MVRTKPRSHKDYLAPFARSLSKPVLSACKAVEGGRSSLGAGRRTVLRQAQHERDRVSFVASWLCATKISTPPARRAIDRTSVAQGQSVSVRVDLGRRRIFKTKKNNATNNHHRMI